MTLIAGFRCNGGVPGGVVLSADSYESDRLNKGQANKLVEYRRDWCTVGIAGAGDDSDVIDATVERIIDELEGYKPTTLSDIKSAVREALKDLPHSDNSANLLISVCPAVDPHASLWVVADRCLHTATRGHEVRGIGSMIRFVAEQLYKPDISLYDGVLLSVHLLRLANKYV